MKIKLIRFYYMGAIFFSLLLLFATYQKIRLFYENDFSNAVYENGQVFVVKDDKKTEEKYFPYNSSGIKNGESIYILHNNTSEYAYIFDYNEILKEELFIIIFIFIFSFLIRFDKKA
jgi:hypothetical protein